MRRLVAIGLLALGCATGLPGQSAGVTLRGEAYDSLRYTVLPNAFITIAGVRSVTSDSRGRFQLDDIPRGAHRLEMQHALLDSIGLPGVSTLIDVTDGLTYLTIAVPAFPTLWRAACGERLAPPDSGFVYGTVRDATTGERLSDAAVDLFWFDIAVTVDRQLKQRLFRIHTTSDANGEFSVCGVPMDQGIRMIASADSAESGLIDVAMSALPVQRRDLRVGVGDPARSATLGSVEGIVTSESGEPVEGARVIVEDVPRAVTGADGRFEVRGVLPGTRQVEVLAASRRPVVQLVDVAPGSAVGVEVRPRRVTTVEGVRIPGSPWQARLLSEFNVHRRTPGMIVLDSAALARLGSVPRAMQRVRGLKLSRGDSGQTELLLPDGGKSRCVAHVWLDGFPQPGFGALTAVPIEEIAVLEVIPEKASVPWRYPAPTDCGALIAWTKAALR